MSNVLNVLNVLKETQRETIMKKNIILFSEIIATLMPSPWTRHQYPV